MSSRAKCILCGSDECVYLCKGIDRFYGIEGYFDFFRCDSCGLIFIFPIPEKEKLGQYYPNNYYSYINTERSESEPSTVEEKTVFYLKHPVKALNCLLYSKLLKQKDILGYRKGAKVLDIGCGDGKYLLAKQEKGCSCFGVDINEEALRRLKEKNKNIDTFFGNLWEAGLMNESFDIVNLDSVLEHIAEPEKLLNEIKRVMKKNAILRVVVPNSSSLTYKIFRQYWMGLDCPRHLYTFSIDNMKQLFKNTKLKIQRYRTVENFYDFSGSLIYIFNALLKRKVKVLELSSFWDNEIMKLLFFPYAFFVNLLKIGDSVEFIVRKKEY